jgi:hypothetical protein
MTRKYWRALVPSLIVGAGILVATFVGVHASGGWVLAGPLLLTLALISADVLDSRLHGASLGPSAAALIVAVALLAASLIVMSRDPALVKTLVPIIGAAGWVPLLRPRHQHSSCERI